MQFEAYNVLLMLSSTLYWYIDYFNRGDMVNEMEPKQIHLLLFSP